MSDLYLEVCVGAAVVAALNLIVMGWQATRKE